MDMVRESGLKSNDAKTDYVSAIAYGIVVSLLCATSNVFSSLVECRYDDVLLFEIQLPLKLSLCRLSCFCGWVLFYTGYIVDEIKGVSPHRINGGFDILGWMFFMMQAITINNLKLTSIIGSIGIFLVTVPLLPDAVNWALSDSMSKLKAGGKTKLLWVVENVLFIGANISLWSDFWVLAFCLLLLGIAILVFEKFFEKTVCTRWVSKVLNRGGWGVNGFKILCLLILLLMFCLLLIVFPMLMFMKKLVRLTSE